jgi:hypothetical protein
MVKDKVVFAHDAGDRGVPVERKVAKPRASNRGRGGRLRGWRQGKGDGDCEEKEEEIDQRKAVWARRDPISHLPIGHVGDEIEDVVYRIVLGSV